MSALEIWFIVVGSITMITFWGWAVIRVRIARETKVPDEVRDTSHAVKNEVMQVRAGLKQISKSPDPVRALVIAMTGHDHERRS